MGAVGEWVLSQDRPTDLGRGEVRVAPDVLSSADDPVLVAGAIGCIASLGEASAGSCIFVVDDRPALTLVPGSQDALIRDGDVDVIFGDQKRLDRGTKATSDDPSL